jgi:hypothetical protein
MTSSLTRTSRMKVRPKTEASLSLKGELTGKALIEAMEASPYREIDLAPERLVLPVRDVSL